MGATEHAVRVAEHSVRIAEHAVCIAEHAVHIAEHSVCIAEHAACIAEQLRQASSQPVPIKAASCTCANVEHAGIQNATGLPMTSS